MRLIVRGGLFVGVFAQLCNELLGELADVLLFRPEPTASVASSVRTSARELDTGILTTS